MSLPYSVKIIWSEEDEAFLATIPEFPGLSAFGETQQEALEEALFVAEDMIDIKEEDGDPLPEPIYRKEYSGQFRVRLPKSLHETLAHQANDEGVSLNTHIISLLSHETTWLSAKKQLQEITGTMYLSAVIFKAFAIYHESSGDNKKNWGGSSVPTNISVPMHNQIRRFR
jgi:predicted HicB family RNase H-like nuclease